VAQRVASYPPRKLGGPLRVDESGLREEYAMANISVLVIDDDPSMLELAEFRLRAAQYDVATALTSADGLALVEKKAFDVVLTDLLLPDMSGIELVKRLKTLSPATEIIIITGYGSVTLAVEATKAGAFYFVEKPVDFDELLILVEKAFERRKQAEEIKDLRGKLATRDAYYNIIGGSRAMQNIYEIIESVAVSDANILIVGESGTGKELVANAIHYRSQRSTHPFVKVNCAALPKELIESELFGHTKGAFTGATVDKIGLIGQSDGGSLLMDEIGEMPLELQPKLLRVLQERVYYRLGSRKANEVDFRLIAATNRDPLAAVRDGHLRDDLYYRINTIEIRVPPLRERVEDVHHLAEHFREEFVEKYGRSVKSISQQAYGRLFAHTWPGNVRELRNVIERAVLLSKGDAISVDDLSAMGSLITPQVERARPASDDFTIEEIGRMVAERLSETSVGPGSTSIFDRLESVIVASVLERTKGNKRAAANLLGVYRPRLYSMIRKYMPSNDLDEHAEDGIDNVFESAAQSQVAKAQ
jgi:DNA-binding NtrC family response regulator